MPTDFDIAKLTSPNGVDLFLSDLPSKNNARATIRVVPNDDGCQIQALFPSIGKRAVSHVYPEDSITRETMIATAKAIAAQIGDQNAYQGVLPPLPDDLP